MSIEHPLIARRNLLGSLHHSNDTPPSSNPLLMESTSERQLSRKNRQLATRSGSCHQIGIVASNDTVQKTAATTSTVSLHQLLRDPLTSPRNPLRGSPRRLLWWKNDKPLVNIVSTFKESAQYKDIISLNAKVKDLELFLKFGCVNAPFTWLDQNILLNQDDICEALQILNERLNDSWDLYLPELIAAKMDTSIVAVSNQPLTLTNIYGEKTQFTILEKLDGGGYHNAYLIQMELLVEAVLLVAKEGTASDFHNAVWTRKQIESIAWREETTKKVSTLQNPLFPEHLHTFILSHELSAQPCAAYIIQKLHPLSCVKRKTDFCEKLIALLDKFHNLKCVHGDVKLANILCGDDNEPLFIDLDPYCFVDFTAFKNMNTDDRTKQWSHINQAGISSLYTPPKFQDLMHRYYKENNIDAAFKLLKIKDRYGLALALWELLRDKQVSNLENGMELSQKSYEKIIRTTRKSKMMTDTLKDWVIESLKTGFSLIENDSADTSEVSATSSMNSSTSSITK
jgi:hypothetical protein